MKLSCQPPAMEGVHRTGRCSAPCMGGTVAAPKGFVPLGAVGNAPVGTLFVGAVIDSWGVHSRNGFYHPTNPDLSSDKSHLVRDPSDVMRSNCSYSNLWVAWPGSQRNDSASTTAYQNYFLNVAPLLPKWVYLPNGDEKHAGEAMPYSSFK
ncbi:hypothetical protein OUZ56_015243 [Daphnia magna]|uniref:Uncharacterized protein n=1 Tax=Daphnia magna TaxID=35525 RepID=A0ABR0AM85_9CRUS|nr:hypothetical protein OUZ56_015243 [Daphnia magna]